MCSVSGYYPCIWVGWSFEAIQWDHQRNIALWWIVMCRSQLACSIGKGLLYGKLARRVSGNEESSGFDLIVNQG